MLSSFELAGHVIGLIINRELTEETVDEIIAECEKKTKSFENLNVFIELERGHDITLKALFKGLKYKYSNSHKFRKTAIVTDRKWFQSIVGVTDSFIDIEVRTFDIRDRLEAIQWISE